MEELGLSEQFSSTSKTSLLRIYVAISLCPGIQLGAIWYCRSRLHIFWGVVSYNANVSGCRRLDTGYLIFLSRDMTNRIIGAHGVCDFGPFYMYYIMVCSGSRLTFHFFSRPVMPIPFSGFFFLVHRSPYLLLHFHEFLHRSSHFYSIGDRRSNC